MMTASPGSGRQTETVGQSLVNRWDALIGSFLVVAGIANALWHWLGGGAYTAILLLMGVFSLSLGLFGAASWQPLDRRAGRRTALAAVAVTFSVAVAALALGFANSFGGVFGDLRWSFVFFGAAVIAAISASTRALWLRQSASRRE